MNIHRRLAAALAAEPALPDPSAGGGALNAAVESGFGRIVQAGLGRLPPPGRGRTADRWRALGAAGAYDLGFAKLYEAHVDALAILDECGAAALATPGSRWGVWAAETPQARVRLDGEPGPGAVLRLHGTKDRDAGGFLPSLKTRIAASQRGQNLPQSSVLLFCHQPFQQGGELSFGIRLDSTGTPKSSTVAVATTTGSDGQRLRNRRTSSAPTMPGLRWS